METVVICPDCGEKFKIVIAENAEKIKISKRVQSESMFKDLAEQIHNGTSGLHVGDEITFTLTNGEEATIVVMDTKAFGEGHMAFRFKDALLKSEQMNENDTNAGGYAESGMVKTLIDAMSLLPEDLRSIIRTRTIKEKLKDGSVSTSYHKLWLLSRTEIGSECASDVDNTRFELFKDKLSRICQVDGETVWYWLRSAYYTYTTYFYFVTNTGNVTSYSNASYYYAVCPCFLI